MSSPEKTTTTVLFAVIAATIGHAQTTVNISSSVTFPPGATDYGVSTPTISPDGIWITFEHWYAHPQFAYYESIVRYVAPGWAGGGGWYFAYTDHSHLISPRSGNNHFAWNQDGVQLRGIRMSGVGQVSVTTTGGAATAEGLPAMSRDEQWVAYTSSESNIVTGDTNGTRDVFLRDVVNSITYRVSVDSAGVQGNGTSFIPSLSADGRFIAFESFSTNLAPGATSVLSRVYVRDRVLGTTECVSVATNGQPANGASYAPVISADGRLVAFTSAASDLVAGDTNGVNDGFVRDRLTGVTRRVSVGAAGQANDHSSLLAMSGDGRYVVLTSNATNLSQPSAPGALYLRDRTWSTTETVSALPSQDTVGISDDGRFVVFGSGGSIYLRDRGPTAHHTYCNGDGSAIPCPCGNFSTGGSGTGCANSLGTGGRLSITGAASLSVDTLVLQGSGMPNAAALYIQGTVQQGGGGGSPFGDGLRCVGGQVSRLGTKQNTAGMSSYPGAGDPPVSVRGQVTATGSRFYQAWYRNADPTFCTSATFNLTNGIELIWSN